MNLQSASILVGCLFLLATGAAGAANISQETVDGVVHVSNPATAMLPTETVPVTELWRLGGFSEAEEEFFGVIGSIVIDAQNRICILDSQLAEVRVFDESGQYVRSFGREGEGPGEFRRPSGLVLLPEGGIGVIQPFPSRMILFNAEGTPSGDFSFEPPDGEGFASLQAAQPVGEDLALIYNQGKPGKDGFSMTATLAISDLEGNQKASLTQATSKMDYSNSLCIEKDWNNFGRCWSASKAGRIYSRSEFTEYKVAIWGADGSLERVVEREYEDHPRDPEDVEIIESRWARSIARWVQNPTFDIEPNWNPVQNIFAREDGTVWVQSSRGFRDLDDGIMARFDVFDEEGRYFQEIVLEGEFDPDNDGMFLDGPYIFVVTDLVSARMAWGGGGDTEGETDEEPEPMTIICYQMNYNRVAQN